MIIIVKNQSIERHICPNCGTEIHEHNKDFCCKVCRSHYKALEKHKLKFSDMKFLTKCIQKAKPSKL